MWPHNLTKGEDIGEVLREKPQAPEARGVWGAEPSAAHEFLRFSHKNSRFSTLSLSEKDMPVPAVSAVTIIMSDQWVSEKFLKGGGHNF